MPTEKLIKRIKYMIRSSQKRKKSVDPIIAFKGKIEYDCASQILAIINELVEAQSGRERAA